MAERGEAGINGVESKQEQPGQHAKGQHSDEPAAPAQRAAAVKCGSDDRGSDDERDRAVATHGSQHGDRRDDNSGDQPAVCLPIDDSARIGP